MRLSKHGCQWFSSAVAPLFAKVCLSSDRPFIISVWEHNCSNYSTIGAAQLEQQHNERIYHTHPLQLLPHSWAPFFFFLVFVHHLWAKICRFALFPVCAFKHELQMLNRLLNICLLRRICSFDIHGDRTEEVVKYHLFNMIKKKSVSFEDCQATGHLLVMQL